MAPKAWPQRARSEKSVYAPEDWRVKARMISKEVSKRYDARLAPRAAHIRPCVLHLLVLLRLTEMGRFLHGAGGRGGGGMSTPLR